MLAALAACQPLPQPFRNGGASENPLPAPEASLGVRVIPVAGAPAGARLAETVAEALRRRHIPAHVRAANRRSFILAGVVRRAPSEAHPRLAVDWTLTDADGRPVGRHESRVAADPRAWAENPGDTGARLATDAAPAVVRLLGGPALPVASGPPPVAVLAVDGAPGDGGLALRRAMAYELGETGLAVREELTGETLAVLGGVRLGPAEDGTRPVEITWTVVAPDGETLGEVRQRNRVPEAALDGAWGPTAALVARAGAPGIRDLIARAAP